MTMKRKGMTLMEVLVSMFIMAIGMLGVLAIFPAAADMMGRAIANAQIAEGLVNARAMHDGVDWMSDNYVGKLTVPPTSPLPPGWTAPGNNDSPIFLFLDQAAGVAGLPSLANVANAKIPTIVGQATEADINGRFFTLNSDVVLNKQGLGNVDDDGLTVAVDREGKFTLAHFFMKPLPMSAPGKIRRHILIFKGRSQSPTDYTSFNVAPGQISSPTTFRVTGNSSVQLKPRQWLMGLDTPGGNPNYVEFFEVRAVHEGPGASDNVEIEISPSMTTTLKRVYFLKDVLRVVLVGS